MCSQGSEPYSFKDQKGQLPVIDPSGWIHACGLGFSKTKSNENEWTSNFNSGGGPLKNCILTVCKLG